MLATGSRLFRFLGTEMRLVASGEETGNSLGIIEQVAPAGFRAPRHVHHAEEEAFYIISGEIEVVVGVETKRAPAGTLVWLPRDVPHHFSVISNEPAHLLQLNTPGGLEQFFVALGTPPDAPEGPPDFERLGKLAAQYSIDMLGN